MRTNPKFESDEFESNDEPDLVVDLSDDLSDDPDEAGNETADDPSVRHIAARQRIEEHWIERQLRSDLDDWDFADEYPAMH